MTYDLSNNEQFHECPEAGVCSLSQQVNYYMNSYASNGMSAFVGYEIGIPAFVGLTGILAKQGSRGGFFWELYKPPGVATNVDVTSVAQQICKAALGANTPRCSGVIPQPGGPTQSPTQTSKPTGTVTVTVTTTTTTTTTPIPTNPTCNAPAWVAGTAYTGGAVVSYNGRQYTAKWWTQGDTPGSAAVWSQGPACSAALGRRLYY
ncbi:hypothetical protein BGZ65_010418 [Modicella reniformis]|uniref:Chitin-binding type-3 domain-containing protein n=1 Tax=Modicella reniformis TaxID=1440133 RepID=A0A9P6IHK7_9FUNG|nr:hypothetical protein BGZ65_010418 [Modicella reniformis]